MFRWDVSVRKQKTPRFGRDRPCGAPPPHAQSMPSKLEIPARCREIIGHVQFLFMSGFGGGGGERTKIKNESLWTESGTRQPLAARPKTNLQLLMACWSSSFSVSSCTTFCCSAAMLTRADACAFTSLLVGRELASWSFLFSPSSRAMRESRCLQRSAM